MFRHKLAVFVASVVLAAVPTGSPAQAETGDIPFPTALEAADISVPRLDDILEYALILGNGDVNALVYSENGSLILMLTKNDVWDARLDTKLDPPLPTLARIKELAFGKWPDRNWVLPEGSRWSGPDSYHAHAYPCPRACARVRLRGLSSSNAATTATTPARIDLRRAVVHVAGARSGPPKADVRALAQSNAFLIETTAHAQLLPFESADIPAPARGESKGAAWVLQEIPGDPDWPGMSFAVALAANGKRKAVAIVTSLESKDVVADAAALARSTAQADVSDLVRRHEAEWERFWSASGIDIADPLLRDVWYRNLYFLRCVAKPGVVSPGLFAGLINDRPAWHGDYHTNYNIQQTFWASYCTNHCDLAEPYDRLISEYLPRARWIARQAFDCAGAYFPHVLYAYEPSDPTSCQSPNGRQYIHHVWGFTVGVAGFTVQPLWWHYKYEPRREFLEKVAYPAVRDVAVFYADFINRCEGGDKIVLAPSVSPEHWGWTPKFERNRNCAFDIAMVRYTLEAAIEGATTLGRDPDLITRFRKSLDRLPDYPTTKSEPPVVVDVLGARPVTYNIPVPATPVFPGDQVTIFSPQATRALFVRTIGRLRHNGNNAPVMLVVARARLSMPDASTFAVRELRARLRPNGTLTLNRRKPKHDFNTFGHYTEMFGAVLPVSELLLQSVGDVIRVFPAWPKERAARFHNLRTQGGFLVSAGQSDGRIERVAIVATAGGRLRLLSPWPSISVQRGDEGRPIILQADSRGIVELDTHPGERLVFQPAPSTGADKTRAQEPGLIQTMVWITDEVSAITNKDPLVREGLAFSLALMRNASGI